LRFVSSTQDRGSKDATMPRLIPLAPLVREQAPLIKDRIKGTAYGDLVRPELLPKPSCEVWLICGPPASGKSTYVETHRGPGDLVIDIDRIARQTFGMGRERDPAATGALLLARNQALADLATEPPERVAWFITGVNQSSLERGGVAFSISHPIVSCCWCRLVMNCLGASIAIPIDVLFATCTRCSSTSGSRARMTGGPRMFGLKPALYPRPLSSTRFLVCGDFWRTKWRSSRLA
jgi:AAA domain